MQQSSVTPKNQDVGIGLQKIVACSHSSSCAFLYLQFLAQCHPYILVSLLFLSRLSLDCSARRDDITRTYVVRATVHVHVRMRMCVVRTTEVVTCTCNQDKMASV